MEMMAQTLRGVGADAQAASLELEITEIKKSLPQMDRTSQPGAVLHEVTGKTKTTAKAKNTTKSTAKSTIVCEVSITLSVLCTAVHIAPIGR